MPAVSSTHSSPALCTQTGYSSFPSPTSINDGCSLSLSLCLNIHRQRCSSRSLNSLACLPARRTTHTYTHRYTHAHNPWGALAIQSVVFSIVLGSHTHRHTHTDTFRDTQSRLHTHYTHTYTHRKPHTKSRRVSGSFDRAAWKCVPLMGEVRVMKPKAAGRLVYHHLKEQSVTLGSLPELLILKNVFMF